MNDTAQHFRPARLDFANFKPKHFLWQVDGKVATVTLNRPERKNPLTLDSYAELRDTFRDLVYADAIKAVVITGAGENFCSGGDVHEIIGPLVEMQRQGDMAGLLAFTRMTGDLVKAMGCGQARIALTRSPVMRVKASRPAMSPWRCISTSGPMISCTSPPEQKFSPAPVMTTVLMASA